MLPVNSGGHTAYQTFVLENLRKYYPDPTDNGSRFLSCLVYPRSACFTGFPGHQSFCLVL